MIFFELTCELKSKNEEEIVEELNKWKDYYPIEKCIKICERKNLKLPLAYLKMRDGSSEEANDLFIEILESIVISFKLLKPEIPIFRSNENYIKSIKKPILK